ncbi:hypothetical protein PLICRDRAFT_34350 [Plicaturopsis crispa FD-325 SS-3]|nr:hypothetical protein PLICRDRAFT_34350 [Plicaturopsis crispa FD-325 SS-3]
MYVASTVNPEVRARTNLVVLHDKVSGRRVFAKLPLSYAELQRTACSKFAFAHEARLRFETDSLDICMGHNVVVDEDTYEHVSVALAVITVSMEVSLNDGEEVPRPGEIATPARSSHNGGDAHGDKLMSSARQAHTTDTPIDHHKETEHAVGDVHNLNNDDSHRRDTFLADASIADAYINDADSQRHPSMYLDTSVNGNQANDTYNHEADNSMVALNRMNKNISAANRVLKDTRTPRKPQQLYPDDGEDDKEGGGDAQAGDSDTERQTSEDAEGKTRADDEADAPPPSSSPIDNAGNSARTSDSDERAFEEARSLGTAGASIALNTRLSIVGSETAEQTPTATVKAESSSPSVKSLSVKADPADRTSYAESFMSQSRAGSIRQSRTKQAGADGERDELFEITVTFPPTGESQVFRARGRHRAGKILSAACKRFNLVPSFTVLVLNANTVPVFCSADSTLAWHGVKEGSRFEVWPAGSHSPQEDD